MKARHRVSFAAFCRDVLDEPISEAWSVVYRAFDGQPLTVQDLETWRALSGCEYQPRDFHELVAIKGRRAQGSKSAVKFLAYKIHTGDFRSHAARGDRLHVPIIAQSREVGREIMSYLTTFYQQTELRSEVAEIFKTSIELKNGFIISVQTCSYRAPRGITAPLALLDELGVWRVEGADVDREVVRSLTPAMVQFPNRKLILLGSPWVKAGVLFDRWERRNEIGDRLVVHCPTPLMNKLIPAEELAREEQADPQNYRREFLAEWLDDVDQFLPDSDISAAIRAGVREIAPADVFKNSYLAAIDASGLSGKDKFTLSIGHPAVRGSSGIGVAFDLLRGWSRAPVAAVCDEVASLLKSYGLRRVVADQFGFSFLKELLSQRDINVVQLPFTARSKTEIFLDLKVGLSQGRIQLLDHVESLRELRMLESKRTSGGNYSISAPRGQHDDYACVIALLNHTAKDGSSKCQSFLVTSAAPGKVFRGDEKSNPATDPRYWSKSRRTIL
ncbi:MAG: hypothetical protein ACRD5M_05030 [Candidatus Acidiferrales bacterium]